MANTKITSRVIADDAISTDMIQDNAITSAKIGVDVIVAEDLAANSITVSELNKTALSGQSAVTAVGADYILIGDTSDSDNLKKSLLSDVIEDTTLSTEQVQDIVGAMFTSNTETRVAATYEDGDGTIDLVVDDMTANDNTWRSVTAGGNTLSNSETLAFTAGTGISIAESAGAVTITNSIADTNLTTEEVQDIVGAMFSSNTETGITVTYEDGDGTIDLVVGTLNQNTTGLAATATALASARTIGGTSFDGTANIVPATVTVADTTDTSSYVALFESATGDLGPKTDGGITYNAGTGMLTATGFTGPLTGTLQTAAQGNITSTGTLASFRSTGIDDNADALSITITSDEDVLIGQTSQTGYTFAQKLVVGDGDANDGITIQSGSTHQGNLAFNKADGTTAHGRIMYQQDTNFFEFFTNATSQLKIDSVGRVIASKSAMITEAALTNASTVDWDVDIKANATLALNANSFSGNVTIDEPDNPTAGQIISIEIAQDGTPRTVSWHTSFEFAASTAPTVTATASKTDIFSFRYNGSVWQEIGRVQNMAQT